MAIVSRSSNSWVLSLQVFLISIGVLSTAVMLKLAVPAMREFMGSGVPMLLSSLRSWLTPPYLYFVINGIIITIAASSRFYPKTDDKPEPAKPDVQIYFAVAPATDAVVVNNPAVDVGPEIGFDVAAMKNPVETEPDFEGSESSSVKNTVKEEDGEDGFVLSRSTWTPQRTESTEIPTENSFGKEKPLVSVRFGHRKMFKCSPEAGKALGVAKPKRNDTLESTWKMITDGRPIPLARHLKKSDLWEMHGRHNSAAGESFKDSHDNPLSSQSPSPVSGRLRKEPSLSQDELNRRVEAFIKKFNEEMRLQRQESLNQYKEMIRRGAH